MSSNEILCSTSIESSDGAQRTDFSLDESKIVVNDDEIPAARRTRRRMSYEKETCPDRSKVGKFGSVILVNCLRTLSKQHQRLHCATRLKPFVREVTRIVHGDSPAWVMNNVRLIVICAERINMQESYIHYSLHANQLNQFGFRFLHRIIEATARPIVHIFPNCKSIGKIVIFEQERAIE